MGGDDGGNNSSVHVSKVKKAAPFCALPPRREGSYLKLCDTKRERVKRQIPVAMAAAAAAALLVLFAFFAASSVAVSDGVAPPPAVAGGLIASACNRTLYYDVCVDSLASRPGSRRADLRGLASISLDVGLAHARATVALAKALSKRHAAASASGGGGGGGGAYTAGCLRDCVEEYSEAVDGLRKSSVALRHSAYGDVNDLVSGAMTNSDTCESAFADKPGLRSPLTERNNYFFKICSIAIAITNLLHGSSSPAL